MSVNLSKNNRAKIVFTIPNWIIPGWLFFWFAIFIGLCCCMPYTQESYDVNHKGEIVKLYTELTGSDSSEEIKTVYKAIIREPSGKLTSVKMKDVYYHTANPGDVFAWSETFEKRPVLGLFNFMFLTFVGMGVFIGFLAKISN